MAQYQITVDSQLLHQHFLSHSQDAGVAKLLESVLNQVLQAQATEQLGAEPYERTEGRQGYRNGTYPHQLTTRVGTITIRVPRIRGGKFSTKYCPLPTQRTSSVTCLDGSVTCLDGDGGQRGINP